MSDRRQTWVRRLLARVGRATLTGLTAMGSCWCGGYVLAANLRQGEQLLGGHGDAEVCDQARRGIAEIEAYLAAVDPPARRTDDPPRRRRGGEPS